MRRGSSIFLEVDIVVLLHKQMHEYTSLAISGCLSLFSEQQKKFQNKFYRFCFFGIRGYNLVYPETDKHCKIEIDFISRLLPGTRFPKKATVYQDTVASSAEFTTLNLKCPFRQTIMVDIYFYPTQSWLTNRLGV